MSLRKLSVALAIAYAALLTPLHAQPAAGGDPQAKDAVAMVESAVKFYQANGQEKAFAAFQDKAGAFFQGELYVFGYDFAGTCVVQGQKPALVGKNRLDVTDVDGKAYIKAAVDLAKSTGKGWVDYKFQNPETKKIEPKTTYVLRVPGKELFLAVGIYKN